MEDVKQTAAVEEKKVNVTESDTDGLNYTYSRTPLNLRERHTIS